MDKFLDVYTEDQIHLKVDCPNPDRAVIALAGYIGEQLMRYDNQKPLDVLLGVVVHTLAVDLSGKLERDFLRNIKENVPVYRDGYRKMVDVVKKAKN